MNESDSQRHNTAVQAYHALCQKYRSGQISVVEFLTGLLRIQSFIEEPLNN